MFDHCFSRNELQNRANWIFSVRYAIPKDTNRLLQLLWIGVIDVRISDFRPVVDAAETLLRNRNIVSQYTANHAEANPGPDSALLQYRNGESRYERDTITGVVHSGAPPQPDPPPHSITSSASASTGAGISRPMVLAALRLITNRYRDGSSKGRSAGFAPLMIRSINEAARVIDSFRSAPYDIKPPSVT